MMTFIDRHELSTAAVVMAAVVLSLDFVLQWLFRLIF